jgi:hypothetical protein
MDWRRAGCTLAIIVAVGFILWAILFPVFYRESPAERSANALGEALDRNEDPDTHNGVKPVLYETTFPMGKSTRAQELIVYPDGFVRDQRDIYSYAIQGGCGYLNDKAILKKLTAEPAIPIGLSNARAVPISRLLILSQSRDGKWTTQYYDLACLPPAVADILRVAHSFSGLGDTPTSTSP